MKRRFFIWAIPNLIYSVGTMQKIKKRKKKRKVGMQNSVSLYYDNVLPGLAAPGARHEYFSSQGGAAWAGSIIIGVAWARLVVPAGERVPAHGAEPERAPAGGCGGEWGCTGSPCPEDGVPSAGLGDTLPSDQGRSPRSQQIAGSGHEMIYEIRCLWSVFVNANI